MSPVGRQEPQKAERLAPRPSHSDGAHRGANAGFSRRRVTAHCPFAFRTYAPHCVTTTQTPHVLPDASRSYGFRPRPRLPKAHSFALYQAGGSRRGTAGSPCHRARRDIPWRRDSGVTERDAWPYTSTTLPSAAQAPRGTPTGRGGLAASASSSRSTPRPGRSGTTRWPSVTVHVSRSTRSR